MDLNISNYVVVNFKAVADLVDAVGGIEVDVQDYEIEQLNKYTIETAKNIGHDDYKLVESAGVQTLEGVQAVSYGRIRKGVGDDFKRTEKNAYSNFTGNGQDERHVFQGHEEDNQDDDSSGQDQPFKKRYPWPGHKTAAV